MLLSAKVVRELGIGVDGSLGDKVLLGLAERFVVAVLRSPP